MAPAGLLRGTRPPRPPVHTASRREVDDPWPATWEILTIQLLARGERESESGFRGLIYTKGRGERERRSFEGGRREERVGLL